MSLVIMIWFAMCPLHGEFSWKEQLNGYSERQVEMRAKEKFLLECPKCHMAIWNTPMDVVIEPMQDNETEMKNHKYKEHNKNLVRYWGKP